MSKAPVPSEDAVLKLRVVSCPDCHRRHLLDATELQRHVVCDCSCRFHASEQIVTHGNEDGSSFYAEWKCPKCRKSLLVPRYAVTLPARCLCGHEHPTRLNAGLSCWPLESMDDAFIGKDPFISEHLLGPLGAAMRYDYEVEQLGNSTYKARNPTTGRIYTVQISVKGGDSCDCDKFQAGATTCAHTEHVRIKKGLPSLAQSFAESAKFAYAWFDKSCLPSRIRVGWEGDIEDEVREVVQCIGAITTARHLELLSNAFIKKHIPFQVLTSAQFALIQSSPIRIDTELARTITEKGREFLSQVMPQLHPFQVEGAMFLAVTQRALLLDEMGLGKTVQAIAAACLLKQFAGIESCLIVAPKSVIKHWESEIRRFTGEQCLVIEGTARSRMQKYTASLLFKAVTLDAVRRDFPDIATPELVILDEAQKVRDSKTLSSRVLRSFESRFFFGLSGTAIEKSLEDLFGILRVLRCDDLESPLEFCASHLICDQFGKAQYTLHPGFFYIRHADRILRREKSDTQTAIPPIYIEEVDLPLTTLQEQMAEPLLNELDELQERLKQRYDADDFMRHRWLVNRIVELADSTALLAPDTNASSKIEWLKSFLVKNCAEAGKKVVIFTRWTRVQKLICHLCDEIGVEWVSLSGSDTSTERDTSIRRFINRKETLAFVSTDAGGLGVNLQVAHTIVNFEPAWNPSTDAQRLQRVHRIGQSSDVYAFLPTTLLDRKFVLNSHPRKQFPANAIDLVRRSVASLSPPTWEELVPVIDQLRK